MWQAIAEENMHCSECQHKIPTHAACLSQMPLQLPEGVRRKGHANFCVGCATCQSNGKADPCYVRYLDHWYTRKEKAPEDLPCGHCGTAIPKGMRTYTQRYFAWPYLRRQPEIASETDQADNSSSAGASGSAGFAGARSARQANAGAWQNLSSDLKRLFRTRGVGGSRGVRSETMAQRLFMSIPVYDRAHR